MPDDIVVAPIGTPYPVVTDELAGGRHVQMMKAGFGADGQLAMVEDANPMPTVGRLNLPAVSRLASSPINVATLGDNVLLAGTAAQTIRVFRFWLVVNAAVALKFKDGAGTDFHPAISLLANGAWLLDFDGEPWFVTAPSNGLVLNLSAAVQVSGRFYYIKA